MGATLMFRPRIINMAPIINMTPRDATLMSRSRIINMAPRDYVWGATVMFPVGIGIWNGYLKWVPC